MPELGNTGANQPSKSAPSTVSKDNQRDATFKIGKENSATKLMHYAASLITAYAQVLMFLNLQD